MRPRQASVLVLATTLLASQVPDRGRRPVVGDSTAAIAAPAAPEANGAWLVQAFDLKLPAHGRTPLRATLKYRRPGHLDTSRMVIEVVAGDPNPQPN